MTAVRDNEQLALDEAVIEDAEAETALEERQRLKERLSGLRKEYRTADDEARFAIARHPIPDGGAVRIGRFRVSSREVPARSVAFDTEPTTRISIAKLTDE
jgi:hypothetical protein